MESYLIMLIAWLTLLCRALGSTIPSLPAVAVLLERASQLRPVYDYVIVGGGTSGLVVANRLTEDPKSTCVRPSVVGSFAGLAFIHSLTRQPLCSHRPCHRVWLRVRTRAISIETLRGADRNCSDGQENGTVVPGLPVPDKYTRTSTSIPQPGLDNRTSVLYTGAVVGGGTVVNGMFFNRGSAADYDAWERLGNPGWGWKDLLPYFKKVSFPSAEEQLVRMVD